MLCKEQNQEKDISKLTKAESNDTLVKNGITIDNNNYLPNSVPIYTLHNLWRKSVSKWLFVTIDKSWHLNIILYFLKLAITIYNRIKMNKKWSKSRLILHMIKLLRMLDIMIHRFTVDSPIAWGPAPDALWEVVFVVFNVKKYHLKP